MRSTIAVLAAALAAAASTGCSEDTRAGGTTATTRAATTQTTPTETTTGTTTEATSSGQSDTRPAPPPDQSRWARQVDAACAPLQAKIDALAPPSDAASLEAWLADVVPLVHAQVAALKAVKTPIKAGEKLRTRLFLASYARLETALKQYLAAIESGDGNKLQAALVSANAAGASTRTYARSLDVTACGGYSG